MQKNSESRCMNLSWFNQESAELKRTKKLLLINTPSRSPKTSLQFVCSETKWWKTQLPIKDQQATLLYMLDSISQTYSKLDSRELVDGPDNAE